MPSLRLENVSKRFGGLTAVGDVSLTVPEGTITGLIGPNGAGKSTVVNLITGMLKLTEGRIVLGDEDIGEIGPEEVVRKGIARTFQNIRLLPEATVLENVLIGFHRHETASILAGLLNLPSVWREGKALRKQAEALLERFRMSDYADLPAGGLAYGHQRRVEMMRAVASGPDVLLLDEPVAGMNDVEADELGVIFKDLAASGMGLLLIEHNVRFVTKLCPVVHVLNTGRMIASGPAEEVMRDPAVITAYLGKGQA
ncbi:ABC transporter ATP-binding protein [uncultured Alsobacter sp.]|uniref:ABC transporter ATP-binding protein n=1 Tax=uncultured Alsobacter sp. TaxID=1748258 RepID=UPI0025DAAE6B|nr:ABC transporter ATP-binding protein [uncultured Alsobacter sp.]